MSFNGDRVGERRGVRVHNSIRVKLRDAGYDLGVIGNISMNARFLEEGRTVTEPSHSEKTTFAFIVCLELWCGMIFSSCQLQSRFLSLRSIGHGYER